MDVEMDLPFRYLKTENTIMDTIDRIYFMDKAFIIGILTNIFQEFSKEDIKNRELGVVSINMLEKSKITEGMALVLAFIQMVKCMKVSGTKERNTDRE